MVRSAWEKQHTSGANVVDAYTYGRMGGVWLLLLLSDRMSLPPSIDRQALRALMKGRWQQEKSGGRDGNLFLMIHMLLLFCHKAASFFLGLKATIRKRNWPLAKERLRSCSFPEGALLLRVQPNPAEKTEIIPSMTTQRLVLRDQYVLLKKSWGGHKTAPVQEP